MDELCALFNSDIVRVANRSVQQFRYVATFKIETEV